MLAEYQQAIKQYRQRVFSFAYYSLRIREDAEDITQDVFIRLWQHWRKVDSARTGAWLMRVTHNSVIDHIRRHRQDKNRVDMENKLEEVPAPEGSSLELQQFRDLLEGAIAELSDPYRSIIIMRDIQGLSYQEIEQTLDLSQSQVKVYLHRGRRQLRNNQVLRKLALEQSIVVEDAGDESDQQGPEKQANREGKISNVKQ